MFKKLSSIALMGSVIFSAGAFAANHNFVMRTEATGVTSSGSPGPTNPTNPSSPETPVFGEWADVGTPACGTWLPNMSTDIIDSDYWQITTCNHTQNRTDSKTGQVESRVVEREGRRNINVTTSPGHTSYVNKATMTSTFTPANFIPRINMLTPQFANLNWAVGSKVISRAPAEVITTTNYISSYEGEVTETKPFTSENKNGEAIIETTLGPIVTSGNLNMGGCATPGQLRQLLNQISSKNDEIVNIMSQNGWGFVETESCTANKTVQHSLSRSYDPAINIPNIGNVATTVGRSISYPATKTTTYTSEYVPSSKANDNISNVQGHNSCSLDQASLSGDLTSKISTDISGNSYLTLPASCDIRFKDAYKISSISNSVVDSTGEVIQEVSKQEGSVEIVLNPVREIIDFKFFIYNPVTTSNYNCSSSLSSVRSYFLNMNNQQLIAYANSHVYRTDATSTYMYHSHAGSCESSITTRYNYNSSGSPTGARAGAFLSAYIQGGEPVLNTVVSNENMSNAYRIDGAYDHTTKRFMLFLTQNFPAGGGNTTEEQLINKILQ